jgi:OFA family oxalate/formate antiporter-like MFS transporter
VVAAAAVVVQAGLGSFYAWSVFREPLSNLYGSGVTGVNGAFFLANLSFSLAAFAAGLLVGRVGPRVVGVAGGVLYGLGLFLSGFAGESLAVLYLTYGLVAGVGLGMGYVAPIAALPGWFPERPGLAYGLAVFGFGAGSAITVPVATVLIPLTGGPLQTFVVLGLAYALLIGGAASLMKAPPQHRSAGGEAKGEDGEDGTAAERAWGLRGALKTWQWYAVSGVFFLNTTAGLAIISDARALAVSLGGVSAALASAFVVIVVAADASGRLLWPALSDRIGQRNVFVVMFLLQAACFALLPPFGAGSFAAFCALSFVVLSCYGGGFGATPALVGAYYGQRKVGEIYGAMITAAGAAGFGAPVLLARSADATGAYAPALYATAALMLLGVVLSLALRPPGPPR